MPQLLIGDANIFIDMECGSLLDRMFAVDYEFAVLDVLFEEELAAAHPELPAKGLRVLGLTDVGVTHAADLIANQRKSGISRMDLLALRYTVGGVMGRRSFGRCAFSSLAAHAITVWTPHCFPTRHD